MNTSNAFHQEETPQTPHIPQELLIAKLHTYGLTFDTMTFT